MSDNNDEVAFVPPKAPNALEEVRAAALAGAKNDAPVAAHLSPKPLPQQVAVSSSSAAPALSQQQRDFNIMATGVVIGVVGWNTALGIYRLARQLFYGSEK